VKCSTLVIESVPFCDLRAAYEFRRTDLEPALLAAARSGRYVLGEQVEGFEAELAAACGARHAVGVGSGTDALKLILVAAGVGAGDEVVLPAYTAAATWMAVADARATPVGADCDLSTGLVDPEAVAAAVGPRTRAVVAVHLFGRLAPMAELREIAGSRLLVEDAAHAHGVSGPEGTAGSLGDAAAFSFYPTKLVGGLGDGGAVTTSDDALAGAVRRLRSYGWADWQGDAPAPGVNSRLDELQAAVLRPQLAALPETLARLRELASRYRDALGLATREDGPYHQFTVATEARDGLRAELARSGIGTALHYDPLPPQLSAFGQAGRFPRAEALAARSLSLPFDPWLSDAQASEVCAALAASAVRSGS
jgi:dTDP-3-amino-3,4,6-trideoxy-alpha-D-glucose transaminase